METRETSIAAADDLGTISKRLKHYRQLRGLSASKVARHIGVAESTYREWEYGRQILGEPYVKLAEILNIGVMELLAGPAYSNRTLLQEIEAIEAAIRRLKQQI